MNSAANNKPQWQIERSQILTLLVKRFLRLEFEGKPVRRAILRAVRRWRGRPLKSAPSRKLKLSVAVLYRVLGEARKDVRLAVALKYRPGRSRRVPAAAKTAFFAILASGKADSMREAYRKSLKAKGVNPAQCGAYPTFARMLNKRHCAALRQLRLARAAVRRAFQPSESSFVP